MASRRQRMVAPLWQRVIAGLVVYGKATMYGIMVLGSILLKQLLSPTRCVYSYKKRTAPPKCLQEVGDHGFVTVDGGLKIHYVERGDKTKPLMLFVHGYPEFWYSWRHQMFEFSKDYWTVAIDMRGYGDSDKPSKVEEYEVPNMVNDIKNVVNALGREKFTLVAHDWGAVISWVFVDTYPEMVERYIMMNGPHPKVFGYLRKAVKEQASKSWYMFFFQLPWFPEFNARYMDYGMFEEYFLTKSSPHPYISQEDIEAFKYTFSQPGAMTPPINYYRAFFRRTIQNGFGPPKETTPTGEMSNKTKRPHGLYIFGAKDIAIDIANVEKHKEYFENVETVLIEEGNHFVQQDEAGAVNNAMRAFLSK